jgi:very-short-patch-repair endonuclease
VGHSLVKRRQSHPVPIAALIGLSEARKRAFTEHLREHQTESERLMARVLVHLGIDAVPQAAVRGWVVDFLDARNRTVIEVDGAIHKGEEAQARDEYRDQVLRDAGYRVIRVTNDEVRHFLANLANA